MRVAALLVAALLLGCVGAERAPEPGAPAYETAVHPDDPASTPGTLEHAWAGNATRFAVVRLTSPYGVDFWNLSGRGRAIDDYVLDLRNRTIAVDGAPVEEGSALLVEDASWDGARRLVVHRTPYTTLASPAAVKGTRLHVHPAGSFGLDVFTEAACAAEVAWPNGTATEAERWMGAHFGAGQTVGWTFDGPGAECHGTYRFEALGVWERE